MNSRAVRLELGKSLETDHFMLVLMRFLNRRGHVKEIRSDNGTNFVGADNEIQDLVKNMDSSKLEGELMQRGCKWGFHHPGEVGADRKKQPEGYSWQWPDESGGSDYGVYRS